MKPIEHIAYNPSYQPDAPLDRIPDGYMLMKIVPITAYEWIMVCQRVTLDG